MPLWGKHSIQGRSLMIHDAFTGAGWVCANIIISSKSGQTKPGRTNKPKPARIRRPIVSTRIGTMEPGSYDGVNKLINLEMEASLALMNMAAYFDRADVSLKGVAGFFREASKKEMEFVWQLIDYLNLRGEGVAPITPKGSSSNNWTSPLEAMEEALDLQNSIDQSLNSLVNDGNDYKLASFLDSNFLQAKTRSISLLMTYVTQLQRVGSGLGEFEFDKTLLQNIVEDLLRKKYITALVIMANHLSYVRRRETMPKYYCDYCDTFLTHDSPSVRKTHCGGRKHKDNVKFYYQKWMEEQAQSLIDQTTAAYKAGKIPGRGASIPPPGHMGGPPQHPMGGPGWGGPPMGGPPRGPMGGGPMMGGPMGGMRPHMGGPMGGGPMMGGPMGGPMGMGGPAPPRMMGGPRY
ncbi:unnamed protein product [Cyprideis torosa]|uniref:U1 small nuclear ribonucleoprotein C n=1 Tax=Cyprideis torosa TaxID=163714 RepID=A0A7R8WCT6_9CRUS|nr:unnamed protein product [Cyprideis torosa]CAG0892387.1 unnamed protein product [Cyprideis torosa]